MTALMMACNCCQNTLIETLLKYQPKCINFKNEDDQTALHIGENINF